MPASAPGERMLALSFPDATCREGDGSGPGGPPHPSSRFPGPQDISVTGGAEASQRALSLAGPSPSSCHRGRGRPAPPPGRREEVHTPSSWSGSTRCGRAPGVGSRKGGAGQLGRSPSLRWVGLGAAGEGGRMWRGADMQGGGWRLQPDCPPVTAPCHVPALGRREADRGWGFTPAQPRACPPTRPQAQGGNSGP